MTNLLAAVVVALVTNVTESAPVQHGSSIYYGTQPVEIGHGFREQWGDPNTKTVTTTVTEVITATFVLDGEIVVTKREREVSRSLRTYRKKIEWEEVSDTNQSWDMILNVEGYITPGEIE